MGIQGSKAQNGCEAAAPEKETEILKKGRAHGDRRSWKQIE